MEKSTPTSHPFCYDFTFKKKEVFPLVSILNRYSFVRDFSYPNAF